MWRTIAVACVVWLVLAAMFIPLERAWRARPQRVIRAEFALDLGYFFGQYLVWNGLSLAALAWVHRLVAEGTHGNRGLLPGPLWLQFVVVVYLGEVLTYWLHRAFHTVPWLWRIHAVHHSTLQLDWLAAHREHPLDGLLVQLTMNVPAIVLGVPLALFGGVVVFRGLWAIVVHANVRLPLGPLRWILGAPEWHRLHHAATTAPVNFANLSPWLDALFGTHGHHTDETYALGLALADATSPDTNTVTATGANPRAPRTSCCASPVARYLRALLLR